QVVDVEGGITATYRGPGEARRTFVRGDDVHSTLRGVVALYRVARAQVREAAGGVGPSMITATLRALDPESSFLDSEAYRVRTDTEGRYAGIGVEIRAHDGVLSIEWPVPGAPADRAGLRRDDQLLRIGGVPTDRMTPAQAVDRIRGAPGSTVTVTVLREGWSEARDVEITRGFWRAAFLVLREVAPGVVYLKPPWLTETSLEELDHAIETANGRGTRSLILDLRDHPGGVLTAAAKLAEPF